MRSSLKAILVLGSILVACSGDDAGSGGETPNLPPPAPTETTKPTELPPNPATCSNVTRTGAPVRYQVVRNGTPPALGGTILPGEYELREVVVYDENAPEPLPDDQAPRRDADPRVAQKTIVLAKDHFRLATGDGALAESGYPTETLSAAWYTVEGTTLKVTGICPTRTKIDIPYTASPYQVVLFPELGVAEFYSLR